mmetsp:Transcript_18745/g.42205  ORF Transcript_18745/g.42205 Transcript_18745/m.42205 type:complete len:407 (+) Transcript_18745:75-1295(+)
MADLPFSLAALLGLGGSSAPPRSGAGGSITLLTLPGRGLVGAAITPTGQEPGFPLPLGLLQSLGGQVSRVPVAEEDAAADALGGIMRVMMEQMAQIAMQRSMEESGPKVPPASERVRDALPRVVVTKEDLLDATNSKCSVCLEDYRPGLRATRMLCGHLFCTACIREWLREANSCPVCRYELATDCEDFESGRRSRMSGRTVRLRAAELRMLRISELRRLMDALGVSGEGCLEKAELLRHLEGAPDVEVTPELEKKLRYDRRELEKLELPLLRNLMERHRVPFDLEQDLSEEEEKSELLQSFADSGWMRTGSKGSKAASQVRAEPKEDVTGTKESKEPQELKEPKEAEVVETASEESGDVQAKASAKGDGRAFRPSEPAPAVRRPRPGRSQSGTGTATSTASNPGV